MNIAVLGAGTMGRAVSALLRRYGHRVVLGTRSAVSSPTVETLAGAIEARSYADAVRTAELILLTTPWEHTEQALSAARPFEHRVLIDCTNPEGTDGRSLAVGLTTSGAEQVSTWAGDARVVKAFNHVYAEVLSSPDAMREPPTLFLAGDDAPAKRSVAELTRALGFDPIDAGPLASARYLEPLAMLMVELVRGQGFGPAEITLQLRRSAALRDDVQQPRDVGLVARET